MGSDGGYAESIPSYPSLRVHPGDPLVMPGEQPRRPPTVIAGVALMATTAALGTTLAALTVLAMAHFNREFGPNMATVGAADPVLHQTEIGVRTALIALASVAAAAAVVMSLLAVGVQAGNNGARVGAWVMCSLGTLGGVLMVAAVIVAQSPITAVNPADPMYLAGAIAVGVRESLPGWFGGAVGSLCGLLALGYIAVAVLLAVPAARAYFQRIAVPWPAAA